MYRTFTATLFSAALLSATLFAAALFSAAGPSWSNKPVEQWNEQDAKQILSASPWVKKITPALLPNVSEEARRQSGRMGGGQGQGVGLTALGPSAVTGVGSGEPSRKRRRGLGPVEVRWESARPVRIAEKTAGEDDPPSWQGDMYAIAIYDVPGLDVDQKGLAAELKHAALLKPGGKGKKELRPAEVQLLPQEGDFTTILYLFPRSVEITPLDEHVEFWARFGRLTITQNFSLREMLLQGKLEL
jgi:hypothetical protein